MMTKKAIQLHSITAATSSSLDVASLLQYNTNITGKQAQEISAATVCLSECFSSSHGCI